MIGVILQFASIVFLGDFNPALTPGVMEDSEIFELAYAIAGLSSY